MGSIILNVDKSDEEQFLVCSACHNRLSDRNISHVCEDRDAKFCMNCEASFRRGIGRRTGEPVLCKKCCKHAEEAKANGIKESWRTSLEKRESELKKNQELAAAENEKLRQFNNSKSWVRLSCKKCGGRFDYDHIPGASFTAIQLGRSKYMACPLCHRWSLFNLADNRVQIEKEKGREPEQ